MDINRLGPRRLACLLVTLVGPAVAAAATPGTFLKLDDDTLRVTAGRDVTLKLETIEPDPNRTSTEMTYRFNEPGYAMVILAAGPGSTKGQTDSIQRAPYCAKLLVRVDPDPSDSQARAAPMKSPGLMAKTGLKVEVSPYIDPTSLPPEAIENGADLPVRVYFEGISQKQVPVTAYGPDGTQQTETTDAHGITRFKVKAPGRWLVRYQHVVDGVTYTGDLVFDLGTTQQGEGK